MRFHERFIFALINMSRTFVPKVPIDMSLWFRKKPNRQQAIPVPMMTNSMTTVMSVVAFIIPL